MSSLFASQTFLMKRFSNLSEHFLYLHLSKKYQFLKCTPIELFHFINFLSHSNERTHYGDSGKLRVIELLNQNSSFQSSINLEQKISLLIGMSNLFIYDQKLLESICEAIQSNLSTISIKQKLGLVRSFSKLQMENFEIFHKLIDQLNNSFEFLDYFDQSTFLHIQSHLYCQRITEYQDIQKLLEIFTNQKNQNLQNYMAQYNYRICQMIFDLYPEIIQQNYYNSKSSTDNPFQNYFPKLERHYRIARKVIDMKTGFRKVNYFESSNFNFLNIPVDDKDNKLTNLEFNVHNVLKSLKIQFQKQQRIIIYDVDFLLPNNVIVNCNGPLHFITNLQKQNIGYTPNHHTTMRHLQQGQYQLINIDYNDWNSQNNLLSKKNYLKKLINIQ